MKKIVINISDNLVTEYFHTKKVFVDDVYIGKFRKEISFDKPENAQKVRVELLGGIYSTEADISSNNDSYLLELSNKSSRIIQYLTLLVASYIMLDVIALHFLPVIGLHILLWGTLFLSAIYLFATRKNRYSVSAKTFA